MLDFNPKLESKHILVRDILPTVVRSSSGFEEFSDLPVIIFYFGVVFQYDRLSSFTDGPLFCVCSFHLATRKQSQSVQKVGVAIRVYKITDDKQVRLIHFR